MDDPAVLASASGHIVIGTNWTLRLLTPSLWFVADADVWKSESHMLAGIPEWMAVVVQRGIFGGGVYSTAHTRKARMIGRTERRIATVQIEAIKRGRRSQNGMMSYPEAPPRMPKRITDPFHPGGNSLCFTVQLAHLMGCTPIVACGFTLQTGVGYHAGVGRINPVTRRSTVYETKRALSWLRWYGEQWPGRLLLHTAFAGPVYDVLPRITDGALQALALPRPRPADVGRHEPDADGGPAAQVEPVRHAGGP